MIKKELARTILLFFNRVIRGLVIPNLFTPLVYGIIVQIFAISRFSSLLDFGYREFMIHNKSNRFHFKRLTLISLFTGLTFGFCFHYFFDTYYVVVFIVPIFFIFFNLKYVFSVHMVREKQWHELLKIEIWSIVTLLLLIFCCYFYIDYRFELFFLFEILLAVLILSYFYLKLKYSIPPKRFSKPKITQFFNSFQEFCIGNIDSVILSIPFISTRGLLAIYIGITSIGLIFVDPFSNFVIENKIKRKFVYLTFLSVSMIVFIIQIILLHEDSFFQIISWTIWDINLAIFSVFLLNAKLIYNYERKFHLIKSLSDKKNMLIQNVILIFSFLVSFIFVYSYL